MITVEELWASKYAAIADAAERDESARRAEDFIDLPRSVCGFPLRALTPRDLLLLDYAQNPFVAGGPIDPPHIAQFLLALHADRPIAPWSRRRFFAACNALDYDEALFEIRAYLDRTFADAPPAGPADPAAPARPIGTSIVAPLIVRIAAGIPSLTPPAIMDTPLPQLFQYQKILAAEAAAKNGGKFRERTPTDRLLCACLEEANQLNAADSQIQNPEISDAAPAAASAP